MRKVKQIVKQNGLIGQNGKVRKVKTEAKIGAGDEIRTRDFLLGKETCYHCTTPASE
jgi:hypothetical protein